MRYQAFLSYSREDDRSANWLHRTLDTFRTPKDLVGSTGYFGRIPPKLHPVFRDRTDLSGGGSLSSKIEAALADSERLILLCSPSAAQSHWVEKEVKLFQQLGRSDRIFPVIAADLPHVTDIEEEFYPPSLRGKGLLAADLREIRQADGRLVGDGRHGGKLKLIAGLLGVPLDVILRRERSRQRRVISVLTASLLIFILVAIAAVLFGFESRRLQLAAEKNSRTNAALAGAERALNLIEPVDRFMNWSELNSGGIEGAAPKFEMAIDAALAGLEDYEALETAPGRAKDAVDQIWRITPPALSTWRFERSSGVQALEWKRDASELLVTSDAGLEVWSSSPGAVTAELKTPHAEISLDTSFLSNEEDAQAQTDPTYFARWCGDQVMIAKESEGAITPYVFDPRTGTFDRTLFPLPLDVVLRCTPTGDAALVVDPGPRKIDSGSTILAGKYGRRPSSDKWQIGFRSLHSLSKTPTMEWLAVRSRGEFVDITWSHDGAWVAIVGTLGGYVFQPDSNTMIPVEGRFLGWEQNNLRFTVFVNESLRKGKIVDRKIASAPMIRSQSIRHFSDVLFLDLETVGVGYLSFESNILQIQTEKNITNLRGIVLSPNLLYALFNTGICDKGNGPMYCKEVGISAYSIVNGALRYNIIDVITNNDVGWIGEIDLGFSSFPSEYYFGHEAPPGLLAWRSDGTEFATAAPPNKLGLTSILIDPTVRVWKAPNTTSREDGPGFHRVELSPLCEGELLNKDSKFRNTAKPLLGGFCDWTSSTRGGWSSMALDGWITSLEWTDENRLRLGLTEHNCNACAYGPAVRWVEYDISLGSWVSAGTVTANTKLDLASVIGPDPSGRERVLAFGSTSSCKVDKDEPNDDLDWAGGPMFVSGESNLSHFVCVYEDGQPIVTLTHDGPVNSMRWSPDGAFILTASDDGNARIFDAGSGAMERQFQIEEREQHDKSAVLAAEWSIDQKRVALLGPSGLVVRPVVIEPTIEALYKRRSALQIRGVFGK